MKITITDENVRIKNPKPFPEMLNHLLSVIHTMMRQLERTAPEELKKEVHNDLYDMFNAGASALLNVFAPELALRPDLTEMAILEAENKIIQEGRAPELTPEADNVFSVVRAKKED